MKIAIFSTAGGLGRNLLEAAAQTYTVGPSRQRLAPVPMLSAASNILPGMMRAGMRPLSR